jgi:inner membrane protein
MIESPANSSESARQHAISTREVLASPLGKIVVIGILVLLLAAPLLLVGEVATERQTRHRQAVNEIAAAWGRPQHLAGPILVVPFSPNDQSRRGEMYILPDALTVRSSVQPEIRYRGPFEATVYTTEIAATGAFTAPANLAGEPQWQLAYLLVGVGDLRSVQTGAAIQIGDQAVLFEPDTQRRTAALGQTMIARPAIQPEPGQTLAYRFSLRLNGTGGISFLPFGRDTRVEIAGPWAAPSFVGAFLPAAREAGEQRFAARWEISQLGRGYGQRWLPGDISERLDQLLNASRFGVEFLQPVNTQRQTERALKYGVLFLVTTFCLYYLFEIIAAARLHLIHYGLVGLSLCLFFLLLLSLGEQIGFGLAYAVSAAAVVAQSALYTWAVTRGLRLAATFAGFISGLYAILYVILSLETYALVVGSVVLFAALSALMYATRRIDWASFGARPTPPPLPASPAA